MSSSKSLPFDTAAHRSWENQEDLGKGDKRRELKTFRVRDAQLERSLCHVLGWTFVVKGL